MQYSKEYVIMKTVMKDEAFSDNRSGVWSDQGEGSSDERQENQPSAASAHVKVWGKETGRNIRDSEASQSQHNADMPAVSGTGTGRVRAEQARIPSQTAERREGNRNSE